MDTESRRKLISRMDNEPPIVVRPSIAKEIGLNEAIVLQQLMYWLNRSKNVRDGRVWVYKTYLEWEGEFPFWSNKTIRRIIKSLKDKGLIETTSQYNRMSWDDTLWYTIPDLADDDTRGQVDQGGVVSLTRGGGQVDHTNNHRLPEITNKDDDAASAVFKYLDTNAVIYSSIIAERYNDLIDEFGAEVVLGGMQRAKEKGKLGVYKYVLDCINSENASRKRKSKPSVKFTQEEQDFLKGIGF